MCETNKIGFTPDFEKTEFDNWTVFIDQGGSVEEWMQLLKEKKWKFKPDAAQLAMACERKFRPLMNRYFFSSNYLEEIWASMCDANNFSGETAERFEKAAELCKEAAEFGLCK